MQQLNLDWILSKLKTLLRLVPDDGAVGQILRRTRDGAVWSDEQGGGGGGAVESVNGKTGAVVLGKSDVGLANVDNVKQYSATNPPPYPVTSVNGQTGAVVIPTGGAVDSVNGQTGAVVLDAADVGALPDDYTPPVTSVNGQTGAVVVNAVNPPDITQMERTALVHEQTLIITSVGGWYMVAAINRETKGSCSAFLADETLTTYYAASNSPSGTYTRTTTPWIYFPAGFQFAARAFFTYANTSGVYYAPPIS